MVGVEGPRAWWGVGLARHAGHTEAILQQRQLFTRNHQGRDRKRRDNSEEGGDKKGGGGEEGAQKKKKKKKSATRQKQMAQDVEEERSRRGDKQRSNIDNGWGTSSHWEGWESFRQTGAQQSRSPQERKCANINDRSSESVTSEPARPHFKIRASPDRLGLHHRSKNHSHP